MWRVPCVRYTATQDVYARKIQRSRCCQIFTEILPQEKNNFVVITPFLKMGTSRWILDSFQLNPLMVHIVTGEET